MQITTRDWNDTDPIGRPTARACLRVGSIRKGIRREQKPDLWTSRPRWGRPSVYGAWRNSSPECRPWRPLLPEHETRTPRRSSPRPPRAEAFVCRSPLTGRHEPTNLNCGNDGRALYLSGESRMRSPGYQIDVQLAEFRGFTSGRARCVGRSRPGRMVYLVTDSLIW